MTVFEKWSQLVVDPYSVHTDRVETTIEISEVVCDE